MTRRDPFTANQIHLERLAHDDLMAFWTDWDTITPQHVRAFERKLRAAKDERSLQVYLEKHPLLLIQHLGGGGGRYVIPKPRFGREYVPDFVIGERDSNGFHWELVELESPTARMFTKAGDPARALNHAIRQIHDWRDWLGRNRDYATRRRSEQGLGLLDIDASVRSLVLIGRRATKDEATKGRRRQMNRDGVRIHSYDYLIEAARGRIASLAGLPADGAVAVAPPPLPPPLAVAES